MPTEDPATTAWSTTSDSWSPKLRYVRRYISLSASESSWFEVPACGIHVPPPLHAGEKDATGTVVGPVNVVLVGVVQSTWNRHKRRLFVPKLRTGFGAPPGGEVVPSTSEARRPPYELLSFLHWAVAGWAASILARS